MTTTPPTYSSMTNAQFLLAESALVAQALLDGTPWSDLRLAAQESRLFGPGKASSQLTLLRAVQGRLSETPREVWTELAHGTLETRRLLMLAMITRQKPLLRAFVAEVVLYQWQRLDPRVTDADARAFLSHQAEQHPNLAAWSPATTQKTRGNLTRFLVDAGLLKESGQGAFEILPQFLSPRIKAAVRELDPQLFPLLEALK